MTTSHLTVQRPPSSRKNPDKDISTKKQKRGRHPPHQQITVEEAIMNGVNVSLHPSEAVVVDDDDDNHRNRSSETADELALLRSILDGIPARVYAKDTSLNCVYANDDNNSNSRRRCAEEEEGLRLQRGAAAAAAAAAQLRGHGREDDENDDDEDDRRVLETGEAVEVEERSPDGSRLYWTTKLPLTDRSTGRIVGVCGYSVDVTTATEQQRQKQQLRAAEEELKRQKQMMTRSLLKASSADSAYLLDRAGKILECSCPPRRSNRSSSNSSSSSSSDHGDETWQPAARDEDGLDKNDYWSLPVPPDIRDWQKEMVAEVFATGRPRSAEKEWEGKWKECRVAPASVAAAHDNDDDGSCVSNDTAEVVESVLLEMSDITERKEPQLGLSITNDDESRYRTLFHNIHVGMALHEVVTDDRGEPVDFVTIDVNPAFEEMLGLKAKDVVGRKMTEAIPGIEKDAADWIGQFGRVAVEGNVENFEKYSEAFDRWYAGLAYRPAKNQVLALAVDITQHIKSHESEQMHRTVFETMKQGVVCVDTAGGSITACNPSAATIMGLKPEQLTGMGIWDPRWNCTHEDGTPFAADDFPYVVAQTTGKPCLGTVMRVSRPVDKETIWVQLDGYPCFRPGERKPFQVILIFTDCSESKSIAEALHQAKEKAEEADGLKSAFLAIMSHEIRTPLNSVLGYIDLALANGLKESNREENIEGLRIAKQSGKLLYSVINDILDISRIEAGQLTVAREPFSLRKVVDQSLNLGKAMVIQRKVSIEFESEIGGSVADVIYGDFWRLQQVLSNLISNAVKFTDTGYVKLLIEKADKRVLEFCVRDTGKGIPESHLESIFQPFSQVEFGDTRKYQGTGLGLAICRKLVGLMGGQITVESSTGAVEHGSAFRFTLPYEEATEEAALCEDTDTAKPELVLAKKLVGGKILVAEDDPVSRKMVMRMLEKAEFDVIVAEDGRDAVSQFESNRDIDFILMDVQMPGMGGLEATALIRATEEANSSAGKPPIPIVALSAGAMKGDRQKGLEAGMTDYLTKPVNYGELMKTLTKYIGVVDDRASRGSPPPER